MTKIFLLVDNSSLKEELTNDLNKEYKNIMSCDGDYSDYITQINNFNPDIIIADNNIENCEFVLRQIKSNPISKNTQVILLLNDLKTEIDNLADAIIELPIKTSILNSTIKSHYKIKQTFDRLYENNKELSRSLYQLNVLYNTSSQFTGTLNTNKLYEIMIEAMEKTLSYDVSSVLLFNSTGKPVFHLNTMHKPSNNLVDALKIRSILNYRTIEQDSCNLTQQDVNEISVINKIKQERSNKIFALEVFNFDSLYAPIKVGEDFFGVVELFRQKPFSSEDVTCFQSIAHQVALPLRSAKLYEEISITNKKLEKLEKLKSEFVSIVSHELRTPLTPINNSLEIVLSNQAGEISEETRNFVTMAKRNIQRLSGIIEDLLDLSRIQTGKLDFKFKIVDIRPSLELLQNTFLQVANEKDIKINLTIQDELPNIYADLRRIEQIFSNLVSNAIKFTSQNGQIDIDAKLINSDEIDENILISPVIKPNGKYIKISVKDNGIGIKREDIPKIFDKFSQIESSLNRNKGGVGLGLTITKQLIDNHLGCIYVESEEKKGSTFSVLLPLINTKKMFYMDLSQNLISNNDLGVIRINSNLTKEIVEKLKECKLINIAKNTKEYELENEYLLIINKISSGSFEAIKNTINDYINQNYNKDCDIILKTAHTGINGEKIDNILKALDYQEE